MRLLPVVAVLLLSAGCATLARTSSEYDSAAVAVSNYWQGVFWTVATICTAVVTIACVWIDAWRNKR